MHHYRYFVRVELDRMVAGFILSATCTSVCAVNFSGVVRRTLVFELHKTRLWFRDAEQIDSVSGLRWPQLGITLCKYHNSCTDTAPRTVTLNFVASNCCINNEELSAITLHSSKTISYRLLATIVPQQ